MTILHFDSDPKRINSLQEMEIMKATTSDHTLNINQNNNLFYKILQPFQDHTATDTDSCWGFVFKGEIVNLINVNIALPLQ